MIGRLLYIWVEGDDDERFCKTILVPILEKKYDYVTIVKYAGMPRGKRNSYLKSIASMCREVLWLADIDGSPCITQKKITIIHQHKRLKNECIIVVVKEIEGWYLAGTPSEKCAELGLPNLDETDQLTKERFRTLMPKEFVSSRDFMVELLKSFSPDVAVGRNRSLKYLLGRIM